MKRVPHKPHKHTQLQITVRLSRADLENPPSLGHIMLEGSSWEQLCTGAQMHVVNVLEALVDSLDDQEFFELFEN